jgi:hypothetical protein
MTETIFRIFDKRKRAILTLSKFSKGHGPKDHVFIRTAYDSEDNSIGPEDCRRLAAALLKVVIVAKAKIDQEPIITWKRIKNFKNSEFKGPVVAFNGTGFGNGIADVSVLELYVGKAIARRIIAALADGKRSGSIFRD